MAPGVRSARDGWPQFGRLQTSIPGSNPGAPPNLTSRYLAGCENRCDDQFGG